MLLQSQITIGRTRSQLHICNINNGLVKAHRHVGWEHDWKITHPYVVFPKRPSDIPCPIEHAQKEITGDTQSQQSLLVETTRDRGGTELPTVNGSVIVEVFKRLRRQILRFTHQTKWLYKWNWCSGVIVGEGSISFPHDYNSKNKMAICWSVLLHGSVSNPI